MEWVTPASSTISETSCDACSQCDDVCGDQDCSLCRMKRPQQSKHSFSLCQLARHNNRRSCWLAADGRVFDATSFLDNHPAGPEPLLKRAGKECSEDFYFHSKNAQDQCKFQSTLKFFFLVWKPLCIGKLISCPNKPSKDPDWGCSIS